MNLARRFCIAANTGLWLLVFGRIVPAVEIPENLAPKAVASASSEYSGDYAARFAVDGNVPVAGSRQDVWQAWCCNGAKSGGKAEFVLEWDQPVDVAEIVYWGRTAQLMSECWKKDTFEEPFQCFQLLYANSDVDVIDIHSYPNNKGGYLIRGEDGNEMLLDHQGYMAIARRLGKPLMIGELGLHAAAETETKIWEETPDYFESYDDLAAARPWVEKTLNSIIDAGVPLTYWWCYQSDRPTDQGKRQRFDIDRHRNPELLGCSVAANHRLKAKLDAR